ncbi:hypothetical protein DFH07DRAFT_851777 [Mycena maculata]|uniref:Secreted protein n=1 Tax=Mycena maculata TaxID=230809 RepID=A0AAD7HSV1_9AGAR|nr:hypothetical protein DFH07DRAFT_851777 [Mycena maculata]
MRVRASAPLVSLAFLFFRIYSVLNSDELGGRTGSRQEYFGYLQVCRGSGVDGRDLLGGSRFSPRLRGRETRVLGRAFILLHLCSDEGGGGVYSCHHPRGGMGVKVVATTVTVTQLEEDEGSSKHPHFTSEKTWGIYFR